MKILKIFVMLILINILLNKYCLSQVVYNPIENLSLSSLDIIEGKVLKVERKWDKEHRFIYSFITISISKSYKGKISEKEILLREIGGSLDGYTTYAELQPEYKESELVLVFLRKNDGYYHTAGLGQGKFIVEKSNNQKLLKRAFDVEMILVHERYKSDNPMKMEFKYSEILEIINK